MISLEGNVQPVKLMNHHISTTNENSISIYEYKAQNVEIYSTIIYNGKFAVGFETKEKFETGESLNTVFCNHRNKYEYPDNTLDLFNNIKVKYENKKLTFTQASKNIVFDFENNKVKYDFVETTLPPIIFTLLDIEDLFCCCGSMLILHNKYNCENFAYAIELVSNANHPSIEAVRKVITPFYIEYFWPILIVGLFVVGFIIGFVYVILTKPVEPSDINNDFTNDVQKI